MEIPTGFDLKALRTFVLVAECGSMTQAARQLGMTQSSVSEIVGNLEQGLGATLFDRALRPLALTAAGGALYERGRALLGQAGNALQATRAAGHGKLSGVTLALIESVANTVGPLLVSELSGLAQRWRVWSGISPDQQAALLSRAADAIVTTSDELDGDPAFEQHPILTEWFLLALPAHYRGETEPLERLAEVPFVRYSLRSAIGRQIEAQLNRLRLDLPLRAEFDTASGQLAAVAEDMGWSLTTPLCLLQERQRVAGRIRVERLTRGRFSRRIRLVARKGDLGETPRLLAETARRLLRERCLPPLFAEIPWLAEEIAWPEEAGSDV
ncbi:MAG: LysR family transcriptional regulator [Kiloniellales bacterium]